MKYYSQNQMARALSYTIDWALRHAKTYRPGDSEEFINAFIKRSSGIKKQEIFMSDKLRKAIGWWATAAVCIAYGVFALASEPTWWATAIAVLVPIISAVIGKPWQVPRE